MDSETKTPTLASSIPNAQVTNVAPGTPPPKNFDTHKFLAEATKLTVLAAFVLYSVGFLTWQSYLSKYGASAAGFLRVEYISAAFCYLFVLIIIGGPPAVVFDQWQDHRAGRPRNGSLDILLAFWGFLVLGFRGVFFPGRLVSSWVAGDWIMTTILIVAGSYIVAYIFLAIRHPDSKITKVLRPSDPLILSITCLVVLSYLLGAGIDKRFLFSTTIFYWFLFYVVGPNTRLGDAWARSNLLVRILIGSMITLMIVSNVQHFGNSVFGMIPRRAGGGKPETAFIRFTFQYLPVA